MQIIERALLEFFKQEEYSDCFIVEVKSSPSGSHLEVFVDSDSQLTLKKCTKISRYLEELIEEKSLLPEKYKLDVSSPGIDRPLLWPRQYLKNIGRKIKVKQDEKKEIKGKLISADDKGIKVEVPLTRKQAKELGVKSQIEEIMYSDILNAKIQISF